MKKRYRLLIVAFVLALVAAACSSSDSDSTTTTAAPSGDTTTTTAAPGGGDGGGDGGGGDEIKTGVGVDAETKTIKLGLLADLTGAFSTLVIPITDAQQVYWDNVNAAGGIDGWTVELVIEDTAYNLEQHLEKFEKLRGEVAAFSQSTGSPTSVAAMPSHQEDGSLFVPLSWYSGWSFPEFDQGVAFEQNTNYCLEGMNLAHFAVQNGATSISLATFPSDYGFDFAEGVKLGAAHYGVEIGYDGSGAVIPGQDFTGIIQGIAESGSQWTMFATNPTFGAEILAGAVNAGYTGMFTGAAPSYHPALLDTPAAPLYDGLWYQSAYQVVWGTDTPGNNEMMEAMREAYPDRRPDDAFIIGWNESIALHRALEAALAAKDITPEGIVAAANSLTGIDFGGSQPNQSYVGTPNEFVQRGLSIYDISLEAYTAAGGPAQTLTQADASTGSVLMEDFFIGDAAAAFDFVAPCYEL